MITATQVRAARALLNIDQRQLADLSGLSVPTIQRMEGSDGVVRGKEALRRAPSLRPAQPTRQRPPWPRRGPHSYSVPDGMPDELSVKKLMQEATARAAIPFPPKNAPRIV